MPHSFTIKYFDQWRDAARSLLQAGVHPSRCNFLDGWQRQSQLNFDADAPVITEQQSDTTSKQITVPKAFLKLAGAAACHRDERHWNVLYRLLWRLTHGEPELLDVLTDDDVYLVHQWQKQVEQDAHKMKAFVRFRRCEQNGTEWMVAWHRPDHRVVRRVAPFFADRFSSMHWSILTPDESVSWDQRRLQYGPGTGRGAAPQEDELEDLWVSYYRSIFNPARIKLKTMRRQMPVRYWPTMPETKVIDQLLADAPQRVKRMLP